MENQSMALAKSLGFKFNLLKTKPFWLCRLFPTFFAGRFKSHYQIMIQSLKPRTIQY